jgi:hypothetical protein
VNPEKRCARGIGRWVAAHELYRRNRQEIQVPGVGIEPTRPYGHGILSPERLPVPPPRPAAIVRPVGTPDYGP